MRIKTYITLLTGMLWQMLPGSAFGLSYGAAAPVVVAGEDSVSYETAAPRNFNALRFSMDNRHRYVGDSLERSNFFVDFGAGIMRQHTQTVLETTPFTTLHLRAGKQLSRLSGLRLGLEGGFGYVDNGDDLIQGKTMISALRIDADYLFSLSSYLLGYRPERALDVSAFLGGGLQCSSLHAAPKDISGRSLFTGSKTAFNGHAGLQFKFFAGNHAAIAIEPYVMLSNNRLDFAGAEENWHKYDVGYGLNLSYIYYLRDVLTPRSLAGLFSRDFKPGERWFRSDSVRRRSLLFVDYQIGLTAFNSGGGHEVKDRLLTDYGLAVGWWLSPAVALRIGGHVSNADWYSTQGSSRSLRGYKAVAIDAMLNPFGFCRNYNGDSPLGISLIGGYELGALVERRADKTLTNSNNYMGYRFGTQLWACMTDNLRLTVEPMYDLLVYKKRNQTYTHDNQATVRVGLQMLLDTPLAASDGTLLSSMPAYYMGVGGGWNSALHRTDRTGLNHGLLKNGILFGGYNYNTYHGIRLSGELLTDKKTTADGEKTVTSLLTTVGYKLDVLSLLSNFQPRRPWGLAVHLGPVAAFNKDRTTWGANAGLQLDYRLSQQFSLFFDHNFYWLAKNLYDVDEGAHASLINSLNIGLAYHFNDLVAPTIGFARNTVNTLSKASLRVLTAIGSFSERIFGGRSSMSDRPRTPFGRLDTYRPVFVDYGVGLNGFLHLPAATSNTLGASSQVAVGWWMEPAVGFRAGFGMNEGGRKDATEEEVPYSHVTDKVRLTTGNLDVMVNPIAFGHQYDWNSSRGISVIAGIAFGNATVNGRNQTGSKNFIVSGLRLGAQVWKRIGNHIRLYVEPMYTTYGMGMVYVNNDDQRLVSRTARSNYAAMGRQGSLSLRIGASVLFNPDKTLRVTPEMEEDRDNEDIYGYSPFRQKLFIALGGGAHSVKDRQVYSGSGTSSNLIVFGAAETGMYTAVRGSFEYITHGIFENTASAADGSANVNGSWHRRFRMGILAADYQYDVTGLLLGFSHMRPFSLSMYAGPALAWCFSDAGHFLGTGDAKGQYDLVKDSQDSRPSLGTNTGVLIDYKLNKHLSVFFNHNLYLFGFTGHHKVFPTSQIEHKPTVLNTFNIGLMRRF